MFNKCLLRIVDASWSCTGQEDELIDLSDFSPTLLPTILWLSAVSYRGSLVLLWSEKTHPLHSLSYTAVD